MADDKRILYSQECDAAADAIGGYKRIDGSIHGAVFDALLKNPYGFREVSFGWHSARYIVTKPVNDVPALLWFGCIWFVCYDYLVPSVRMFGDLRWVHGFTITRLAVVISIQALLTLLSAWRLHRCGLVRW